MKNTYISEGKKFISSKRASIISGYSSDYIGQLCRAGKLDCRMVGHTWYVFEDSLAAHSARFSESTVSAPTTAASTTSTPSRNVVSAAGVRFGVSAKEAAAVTGYTGDYIGQLCRNGKLDCRMFGNTWFITEASLLAYKNKVSAPKEIHSSLASIPDSDRETEPLKSISSKADFKVEEFLPQLSKKNSPEVPVMAPLSTNETAHETATTRTAIHGNSSDMSARHSPYISGPRKISWTVGLVVMVLFFGAVSLVPSGSGHLSKSESSQTAGVGGVFDSIFSFFHDRYVDVLSLFGGSENLAVVDVTESDLPIGEPSGKGLVVFPTTGLSDKDAEIKKDVAATFSDSVEVSVDSGGTSGIITPVFKESKGKDYMFVMVPVKEKSRDSPP